MREYVVKQGDNFYRLSQQFGGSLEEWLRANPGCCPTQLQVGQRILLPELKSELRGKEQYAEIGENKGKEFAGEHLDEVEMDIEGIKFKVKRIGEPRTPHEVHLILPRVEIRKTQPAGAAGPCDIQIMISNVNIAHSPRLMSEGGDRAETPEGLSSKQQKNYGRQDQTQSLQAGGQAQSFMGQVPGQQTFYGQSQGPGQQSF